MVFQQYVTPCQVLWVLEFDLCPRGQWTRMWKRNQLRVMNYTESTLSSEIPSAENSWWLRRVVVQIIHTSLALFFLLHLCIALLEISYWGHLFWSELSWFFLYYSWQSTTHACGMCDLWVLVPSSNGFIIQLNSSGVCCSHKGMIDFFFEILIDCFLFWSVSFLWV